MKRVVWKYELPGPGEDSRSTLTLPRGAQLLDVGMDDDTLVVWAMVDPESAAFEEREFLLVRTGQECEVVERVWRFLGTVVHRFPTGAVRGSWKPPVWHVFSKGARR